MKRLRRILFYFAGASPFVALAAILACFQVESDLVSLENELKETRTLLSRQIAVQGQVNHDVEKEVSGQGKIIYTILLNPQPFPPRKEALK